MKITEVKTFLVTYSNRPRALVKVETDEGLYGWGEVEGFIVFYLNRARLYSFMQAGEGAPADR